MYQRIRQIVKPLVLTLGMLLGFERYPQESSTSSSVAELPAEKSYAISDSLAMLADQFMRSCKRKIETLYSDDSFPLLVQMMEEDFHDIIQQRNRLFADTKCSAQNVRWECLDRRTAKGAFYFNGHGWDVLSQYAVDNMLRNSSLINCP